MSDLRFPIGGFVRPDGLSDSEREECIREISDLPILLGAAIEGLTTEQLDTPYREGGWTLRQVAHHLADSHINSLCRFKLALTEVNPVIRPYEEDAWVRLADSGDPPTSAVDLLRAVHVKWVSILRAMNPDDFSRTLVHPDSGVWNLDQMLALYSWHGRHHVAHVTEARRINGW